MWPKLQALTQLGEFYESPATTTLSDTPLALRALPRSVVVLHSRWSRVLLTTVKALDSWSSGHSALEGPPAVPVIKPQEPRCWSHLATFPNSAGSFRATDHAPPGGRCRATVRRGAFGVRWKRSCWANEGQQGAEFTLSIRALRQKVVLRGLDGNTEVESSPPLDLGSTEVKPTTVRLKTHILSCSCCR